MWPLTRWRLLDSWTHRWWTWLEEWWIWLERNQSSNLEAYQSMKRKKMNTQEWVINFSFPFLKCSHFSIIEEDPPLQQLSQPPILVTAARRGDFNPGARAVFSDAVPTEGGGVVHQRFQPRNTSTDYWIHCRENTIWRLAMWHCQRWGGRRRLHGHCCNQLNYKNTKLQMPQ